MIDLEDHMVIGDQMNALQKAAIAAAEKEAQQ